MRVRDEKGVMEGSEFFSSIPSRNAKELYFYCHEIGHYYLSEEFSFVNHEAERGRQQPFIFCLNEGTLIASADKQELIMRKGDVVFFNTGNVEKMKLKLRIPEGKKADIYWSILNGDGIQKYLEKINERGNLIRMNRNPVVLDKLIQLLDLQKHFGIRLEGKISILINEVLIAMIEVSSLEESDQSTSVIENAIQYINTNYSRETLTVAEIAATCCLSQYYFTRLFKRQMGKSPYQYVTDKRLYYAKSMLYMTDMSIYEISEKVGYGDQTVFIRAFSRKYGITPGKYRRMCK